MPTAFSLTLFRRAPKGNVALPPSPLPHLAPPCPQNKSIRYLVPDAVEDYIRRHSLHLLPNWQLP